MAGLFTVVSYPFVAVAGGWLENQIRDRLPDVIGADEALPIYKKYQQQPLNIKHLFTTDREIHKTEAWWHLLSGNNQLYQNCRVVSVTWVKALASPLSHEFIQFIVEDSRSKVRTRVFSDRQDDGNTPDRVIVGNDWASAKNPSNQKDMPMPLKSLVFAEGRRPTVGKFARLLKNVTLQADEYSLLKFSWKDGLSKGNMCWWYAQTVFDSARNQFGGELKEWPFARYAYTMVVWDGVVTDRKAMESDAREFKKQNVEGMSYKTAADALKPIAVEDYLDKVTKTFENDTAVEQYQEALALDETEKVDPAALKEALQSIESSVQPPPKEASTELRQASQTFVKAVKEDSSYAENMKAYQQAKRRLQEEERIMRSEPLLYGGKVEEKYAFKEAMEAFVGGVLRRTAEEEANTTASTE